VFNQVWRDWGSRRQTARLAYDDLLMEVCEKAGAGPGLIPSLVAERAERQARLLLDPQPEVLQLLTDTKQAGFSIALVSNCAMEDIAAWSQSPFAPLVDTTIFSCDVGSMKPSPEIYAHSIDQLGVPADRAAFVSDSVSDLRAARIAGFAGTFWCTWFLDRQAGQPVEVDLTGEAPEGEHLRVGDTAQLVQLLTQS